MLLATAAEVLSLGIVVPFLSALSNPQQALEQSLVARVFDGIGISTDPNNIRLSLTILFAVAVVVAGLLRFTLIYVSSRVNHGMIHELGAEVFRRSLCQSYLTHVKRNSSEIVGAIAKVDVVAWAITMLTNVASSLLMAISIVITLIVIDPLISIGVLGGIAVVYMLISILTRKQLKQNSDVINQAYGGRVKTVQEGLGSVRDMILDQSEGMFTQRFNTIDRKMRLAQASNAIIEPSPRFGVEALGMVLIALIAFHLTQKNGSLATNLPMLGALALGAQRLMPLVQQIYRGFAYISGNQSVIHDVAELVSQEVRDNPPQTTKPIGFESEIVLRDVFFSYGSDLPTVLRGINLTIPQGACVGFTGETGSGKSTLLDLIMGLLEPSKGCLTIDGNRILLENCRQWQQQIAHVPQTIFLADATFAENIAFGVPKEKIDMKKVRRAAEGAKVDSFIQNSPSGYNGTVGEQGVSLSGGQRQRIGIARALYRSAKVMILDEATSALDEKTETEVIDSLLKSHPELTVLMIAHRLNTLDECDFIVQMANGQIERISNQKSRHN